MKKDKPHGVQLLIRAVVRDPDGKVLSDTGRKPSRSFVIQFLEFFYACFSLTSEEDATDITGSEREFYNGGQQPEGRFQFRVNTGATGDTSGILVGTSDTAKTNEDYKLGAQLTEGVGAGNITHGAMDIGTTAVVGANVDLEMKRSFPNNTGSTITIKETGVYETYVYYSASWPYYSHFCIIRDVLETPIDVPDKCALTIYYTLRTTV